MPTRWPLIGDTAASTRRIRRAVRLRLTRSTLSRSDVSTCWVAPICWRARISRPGVPPARRSVERRHFFGDDGIVGSDDNAVGFAETLERGAESQELRHVDNGDWLAPCRQLVANPVAGPDWYLRSNNYRQRTGDIDGD